MSAADHARIDRTPRKGYSRRSAIPADTLHRLNRGIEPTITLVEWLGVDCAILAHSVLDELGEPDLAAALSRRARAVSTLGIMDRLRAVAAALHEHLILAPAERRRSIISKLSTHRSDIARQWAAFAVMLPEDLDLPRRIRLARPFAADAHMGVREIAWMSLRPSIAEHLRDALTLLEPWTRDADANIRRCAIEATRPRGVWCAHIPELKRDPALATPLLENVRTDPARYVQLSAANWINDASKSPHGAEWARALAARWSVQPSPHTAAILRRALRTINKPA